MRRFALIAVGLFAIVACGNEVPVDTDATVAAIVAETISAAAIDTPPPVPEPTVADASTSTPEPTAGPPTPTATLVPPTPTSTPVATATATPTSEDLREGRWLVEDTTDAFTQRPGVIGILDASEGKGIFGDPVQLVLRCDSTGVSVFIDWHSFITTRNTTPMKWRIGGAGTRLGDWAVSTDFESTFYTKSWPTLPTTREFAEQLTTADRFVAEVTPFAESPIIAVFDLEGIEEVSVKLFGRC